MWPTTTPASLLLVVEAVAADAVTKRSAERARIMVITFTACL